MKKKLFLVGGLSSWLAAVYSIPSGKQGKLVPGKRLFLLTSRVLVALFCVLGTLALVLSYFLPIYSDEIIWKLITARYWLDEQVAIYLHPTCITEFSQSVPLLFLPARFLDSLFYADLASLQKLRVLGILNFVLILLACYLLIKLITKQMKLLVVVALGALSLFFLGKLPFLMVINRPEQIMILCLISFLILSQLSLNRTFHPLMSITLFCLCCLLFFPQHAKSLMFLPFVVCLIFIYKVSNLQRGVLSPG